MGSPATKADDREQLLRVAQRVPDGEIAAAVRYLEYLTDRADPYVRFLLSVPETDHEISEECARALDEGWDDIRAGRVHSAEEVKRELDL